MSMWLYILVIGIMCLIGGITQFIPEIFILIGFFVMIVGITIAEINETRMKERIGRLEDKVEELEKQKKENAGIPTQRYCSNFGAKMDGKET